MAILRGLKDQLMDDETLRAGEPVLQVCKEADVKTDINIVDDGYDGIEYCDGVTGIPWKRTSSS